MNHNHEKCTEKIISRRKLRSSLMIKAVENISYPTCKTNPLNIKGSTATTTNSDVILIQYNINHVYSSKHPQLSTSAENTHPS